MLRVVCVLLVSTVAGAADPRYTDDGQLIRPANYREWVFLSSGLGMTYGAAASPNEPRFDNVFVNPEAYRGFLATGVWPDKTIFALEVRRSSTHGSINRGGHYQSDIVAVEFEVKDEARFPAKWAFFGFNGPEEKMPAAAKPFPKTATCVPCHTTNGAVEQTFVQFYPTLLEVARRKGTLKASYIESERRPASR